MGVFLPLLGCQEAAGGVRGAARGGAGRRSRRAADGRRVRPSQGTLNLLIYTYIYIQTVNWLL